MSIPIASVVGEGGSGGALAIGVVDRVLMLENSIYSVISPESCSAILWKDQDHAREAAENLRLTAPHLEKFGIIALPFVFLPLLAFGNSKYVAPYAERKRHGASQHEAGGLR